MQPRQASPTRQSVGSRVARSSVARTCGPAKTKIASSALRKTWCPVSPSAAGSKGGPWATSSFARARQPFFNGRITVGCTHRQATRELKHHDLLVATNDHAPLPGHDATHAVRRVHDYVPDGQLHAASVCPAPSPWLPSSAGAYLSISPPSRSRRWVAPEHQHVGVSWNRDRADLGDASAPRQVVRDRDHRKGSALPARVGREGHRKGARGGREEAPEVAGPNREEDAQQAQATEEDLARQVA